MRVQNSYKVQEKMLTKMLAAVGQGLWNVDC